MHDSAIQFALCFCRYLKNLEILMWMFTLYPATVSFLCNLLE